MKFYEDPLAHPQKEAHALIKRYGCKERALFYAEHVLTHIVWYPDTKYFWRKVIEELKK